MTATEQRAALERVVSEVRKRRLERRYPGWHIWQSDAGTPCATLGSLTLIAPNLIAPGTWDGLETELADYEARAAEAGGPSWDIFDLSKCDAL